MISCKTFMFIKNLSLTNFRMFRRIEIEFCSPLILLFGNNAQGKTSILEAIHFLSLMSSPIAMHDRELVNFLCIDETPPVSRLVSVWEKKGRQHRLEIRLILNRNRNGNHRLKKEVLIDGVRKRMIDAVGFFNSVLFLPQTMRIIEDGPDDRRRYLDQTLSQAYPGYVKALGEYLQGITKRNALLKQLFENKGDQDQLLYWDQLIAENGAMIIHARGRAVTEFREIIRKKHLDLTNGKEALELIYTPSFDPYSGLGTQMRVDRIKENREEKSIEEIRDAFLDALYESRREEIRRGVTTIGPHRDDLLFLINGVDLGVYGSRGQIRTAVMALKFSEMEWLQQKSGEMPVMLLDETLAEMDQTRRGDLIRIIDKGTQTILTTADLDLFTDDFIQRCAVWEVKAGKIDEIHPEKN